MSIGLLPRDLKRHLLTFFNDASLVEMKQTSREFYLLINKDEDFFRLLMKRRYWDYASYDWRILGGWTNLQQRIYRILCDLSFNDRTEDVYLWLLEQDFYVPSTHCIWLFEQNPQGLKKMLRHPNFSSKILTGLYPEQVERFSESIQDKEFTNLLEKSRKRKASEETYNPQAAKRFL